MGVPEKMITWIGDKAETCRFELHHTGLEGNEIIDKFAAPDEDTSIDDFANDVYERAEQDALTRLNEEGYQRYSIVAFSDGSVEGNYGFVVKVVDENPLKLTNLGSDVATSQKGLIGSFMTHNERMNRQLSAMSEATAGRLAGEVERLSRRNQNLEDHHMKIMDMVEDLKDRKHERELAAAQAEANARRMDQLLNLGMQLLPVVAAKLLPANPLAQDAQHAAIGKGVEEWLSGISEQELAGVIGSLAPQNRLAVMEIYEIAMKKRHAAESNTPEKLRPREDRSDDLQFEVS